MREISILRRKKLIAFVLREEAGIGTLHIVIWNDLSRSKHYSAYGRTNVIVGSPFEICVHQQANSALIVSSNKPKNINSDNVRYFTGRNIINFIYRYSFITDTYSIVREGLT